MRKPYLLIFAALAFGAFAAGILSADDPKIKTGDAAPAFAARATDGKPVSLDTFKDADYLVVVFTCNSCPVAVAYEDRLIDFVNKYKDKGVALVAINNHKDEDADAMKQRADEKDFNFVYAYEGEGKSARDFGAKVTPHCFVLDKDRKVVYQGAFDNDMGNPSEHHLVNAIEALLAGNDVPVSETKAFGCTIKFRAAENQ